MEDVHNEIIYDSAHGAVWITTNCTNSFIDEDFDYEINEEEDIEEIDEGNISEGNDDLSWKDLLPSYVKYKKKKGIKNTISNLKENTIIIEDTITLSSLLSSPPKYTGIPESEIKTNVDKSEPEEVIEIKSESEEDEDSLSYIEIVEDDNESGNEVNKSDKGMTTYIESEEEDNLVKDFPPNTRLSSRPSRVKKSNSKCDCCESTPYLRSRHSPRKCSTSLSMPCKSKVPISDRPESSSLIVSHSNNLSSLNMTSKNTCLKNISFKNKPKATPLDNRQKNTPLKKSKNKLKNIPLKNKSPKKIPKDSCHKEMSSYTFMQTKPPSKKKSRHRKGFRALSKLINKKEKEKVRRGKLAELFSLLALEVPSVSLHINNPKITILKEALTYIKELIIEEKRLSEEIIKLVDYNWTLRKLLFA